ncbi:glycosyl hydrolase family protein [Flammeovirga pectinis]|uniref:Glycosyl hydrolase family protein n=1 Tax=Flammeovirga pectinis TaxID=2494373 RepID=A0A3S9P6E7_9BACT|nr:family 16 glycosylhydrolase [Flammeovirga pectinis]AZQ63795.1 glycosyl hydrolase family protein [Flammeovirga pectinis]
MKRITNIISASALSILSLLTIDTKAQTPFSDPANKQGWVLNNAVSDEFQGTSIDKDKWIVQGENDNYENNFKGRAPSQFVPHAVSVANGKLVITTRWEPSYDFIKGKHKGLYFENITTGAVITKKKFKNGYMEIKCKPADGPLSSAFWFTGKGGELDLFEIFGKYPKDKKVEQLYHTSFHNWGLDTKDPLYGKTSWENKVQLPKRLAEDYHVYGCEWGEDFLKIYVDGQLVRCITKDEMGEENWVMNNEQKVWVDNEVFPWKATPKKEDFPKEGLKFEIDYVRVWQKEGTTDIGCQATENIIPNGSFENGLDDWNVLGKVKVVQAKKDIIDGKKYVKLSAGKEATVSKVIALKPHTTYILSAYARSPFTNMKDVWQNGWLGVKAFGTGQQPIIKYFSNEWNRQSILFTTGANANKTYIYFTNKWQKKEVHVDHFELIETINENKTVDGK